MGQPLPGDVHELVRRIDGAAGRAYRADVGALLACLVAGLLLAFFGFFVLDYLTRFPAAVRLLVTLGLATGFGWVLPRRFRRVWHREYDPVRLASRVEARAAARPQGGFTSLLVSALEFGLRPELPGAPALKVRAIARAHDPEFDPAEVVLHDRRRVRLAWRLVMVAAVVYVAWFAWSRETLAVFLVRAFGLAADYPTRTRIVRLEYPPVSPLFEPIRLAAEVAGERPAAVRAEIRFAGESPFDLVLTAEAGADLFTATVESPPRDLTFRVTAGDAVSAEGHIRVLRPPLVAAATLDVTPPAYTGLPPRAWPLTNLDVPQGSRLVLRVKPDRPAKTCELDLADLQMPMILADDGWQELRDITLAVSTRFAIRLVDAEGIENRDRLFHYITVIPDREPVAVLERPPHESYWAPVSRIRWSARLSDDYGVREARLHAEIATTDENGHDSVQRARDVPIQVPPGVRECRAADTLALADLNLQPGQTLILTVQVRDTCDFRQADGFTSSERHRLHIVSAAELRRIIEEEEQVIARSVDDLAIDVERQIRILDMQEKLRR